MSSNRIDFSEADSLKKIYCKDLLEEYYNFEYSKNSKLFSKISSNFRIEKVEKINNPQLLGMYLLWKEELLNSNFYESGTVKGRILYHVTSPSNALSIAHNNIDWRKTIRTRYGQGACFSPSPTYAHRYAGNKGAFIIFKVLTKCIENDIFADYKLTVPTESIFDTTLSYDDEVYVKYDDYQMYPKFIVYYKHRLL